MSQAGGAPQNRWSRGEASITPEDEIILAPIHVPSNSEAYPELKRIVIEIALKNRPKPPLFLADDEDPMLDPGSTHFDVRKWLERATEAADGAGVAFRRASFYFSELDVFGLADLRETQSTVASVLSAPLSLLSRRKKMQREILCHFHGELQSSEMLLVLGKPGSGCSTFLKTIAGELHGLNLGETSVNYTGIQQKEMIRSFKGEIVYNAEDDRHFPHLTVEQTLGFAAALRTPKNQVVGPSESARIEHVTAAVMEICGLSHVRHTKVGNDYVRGVSGGERKRVSIAEMLVSMASVGCWDNSTRGLDSDSALEFVSFLRLTSRLLGTIHIAALYQASEAIYKAFDKVIVIYEGREIYFGPADNARSYFEDMGWHCDPQQTTPDFLVSVTDREARRTRPGFDNLVPRTPEEFELAWHSSGEYRKLQGEIGELQKQFMEPSVGNAFRAARRAAQNLRWPASSPYTASIPKQIQSCLKRAYHRSLNDKKPIFTSLIGQVIMALVVGSVFYGTPKNTTSFLATGSTLFFSVLLNTVIAVTEINSLYEQRPIVEKHVSYAFHHPFIESLSVFLVEIPIKLFIGTCFNITLYFLAGLTREPSPFFIFYLFALTTRFTMSALFRTVGSAASTNSQAMAIAGVVMLAVTNYTGFTLPQSYMHPWFRWIRWINPLSYAFESMMVNEMHDMEYTCASFVPDYPNASGNTFVCDVPGASAGERMVQGDAYLREGFGYSYSHLWRNFGILSAFLVFFLGTYLLATEIFYTSGRVAPSTTRFLSKSRRARVFGNAVQNDDAGKQLLGSTAPPNTARNHPSGLPESLAFSWHEVRYAIHTKGSQRTLLDDVSGWVKGGSMTALMGVSGAGKTTLLDAVARRLTGGIVSGSVCISGGQMDHPPALQQIGYVQQEDVHLETSTVREALSFSAMLRRPKGESKEDKFLWVEKIIEMLNLADFADAVIGAPGKGLSLEQRKLVTIGVELAANPSLLIFLDEPTSGLDTQGSAAILNILKRLANSGLAILATIHQPSAVLLQKFDNLLFLAKGGRTAYFGEIGPGSTTVVNYFQSHGARRRDEGENPAEYLVEIVAGGEKVENGCSWPNAWYRSEEKRLMDIERDRMRQNSTENLDLSASDGDSASAGFSQPLYYQVLCTSLRICRQHWRTPSYVWGKQLLGTVSALFIGFSFFQLPTSKQGLQNTLFGLFMITAILNPLAQQIMPMLLKIRALYEARERPSRTYSWISLFISSLFVEIPCQLVLGVIIYACYYYPFVGIQSAQRQVLMLLYSVQYCIFATTFAYLISSALPDAETAGTVATLMFSMTMIFNGVFQPPQALPHFWIFMYRVSPLTYVIGGTAATILHGRPVQCAEAEIAVFDPPVGATCGQYLQSYLSQSSGVLYNPSATEGCEYCSMSNADQFLSSIGILWSERWQNFGIVWAYIMFNFLMALFLYGFLRKNSSWGMTIYGWARNVFRSSVLHRHQEPTGGAV